VSTTRERKRIPIEDIVDEPVKRIVIKIGEQMNYLSEEVEHIQDDLMSLPCSNPKVGNHPERCPSETFYKERVKGAVRDYMIFKIKQHPIGTSILGTIAVGIIWYVSNNGLPLT
jgi:hypothetical protein